MFLLYLLLNNKETLLAASISQEDFKKVRMVNETWLVIFIKNDLISQNMEKENI